MHIYYSPSYAGQNFISYDGGGVRLNSQVLETQGLLSQLALHAGIHQEMPAFAIRLADYHNAIMEYDRKNPNNIFHRSIEIDSMSVAKTLLGWRDTISLSGWSGSITGISERLDTLAAIEMEYGKSNPSDLSTLLHRVEDAVSKMKKGEKPIPSVYKDMTISVPCAEDLLPDYIKPLLSSLSDVIKGIEYGFVSKECKPAKSEIITFSQQFKAEAWLASQNATSYDVWINSDNKRLDNWLHMSGAPVAGSNMMQSNPQIVQMFLLAVQLFQRPLNVNTLLQYLYLPECPLPWKLTSRLASAIVREGGFCCERVQDVIVGYLTNELKADDDTTPCEMSPEERKESYRKYLPFDLLDAGQTVNLAGESDKVDAKRLIRFLGNISGYAGNRAAKLAAVKPDDIRIAQLHQVATLIDALMRLLPDDGESISFKALQQWAQSLYETCDFKQYNAQIGSRLVISNPANIINKTDKVIWCDFYGDLSSALSTDFLSTGEIDGLTKQEVKLWKRESETEYDNFMLEIPLHMTAEQLTFIVCKKIGSTDIPIHPLQLQLPAETAQTDGDALFANLPSVPTVTVDNHRAEDAVCVTFDAKNHPVSWRSQESYSALSDLLQNPLDYFMNYTLGLSDLGPTEIKMSLTNGNVAHEVIEGLFTADRGGETITSYVKKAYDDVFSAALSKKGALLLLPEHHLDREKLRHQLRRCVDSLAEIVQANGLTVVKCEQEETEDLGFESGVIIKGFIDMLLEDANKRDVIFDLKWTSSKKKFEKLLEDNRAAQLAIYKAMLQQHSNHPEAAKTAFFVMPEGNLISTDRFAPVNLVSIEPGNADDILSQLQNGYSERRAEISAGTIETAGGISVTDLPYANAAGVFPLQTDGKKKDPKKEDNKYSNYKCFTI